MSHIVFKQLHYRGATLFILEDGGRDREMSKEGMKGRRRGRKGEKITKMPIRRNKQFEIQFRKGGRGGEGGREEGSEGEGREKEEYLF